MVLSYSSSSNNFTLNNSTNFNSTTPMDISGCVRYFKLDELSGPVIDSTGTLNATSVNAVPGQVGRVNNAYLFDGDLDYIDTNSKILSISDGLAEFTFSCWIKLSNTNYNKMILGQYGQGTVNRFGLRIGSDSAQGKLAYFKGGFDKIVGTTILSNSLNTWFHIVANKNSLGEIKIFVNGIQEGVTGTDNTIFENVNTTIGTLAPTLAYFTGIIDEVSFFNRALSLIEIKQLYNLGYTKFATLTSPNTQIILQGGEQ